MSHRPHLLPARYRARALTEMAKSRAGAAASPHHASTSGGGLSEALTRQSSKRRYLRHKRRVQRLHRAQRAERSDIRWLPTHRWHAKRFHMGTRYRVAVRIPLAATNRGARAALRAAQRVCVVRDVSHERCISVHAHESDVCTLLAHLAAGAPVSRACLAGACALDLELPVGPVLALLRPTEAHVLAASDPARELWLWMHCDAAQDVLTAVHTACDTLQLSRAVQVTLLDSPASLACFELRGPLAGAVVARALVHAVADSEPHLALVRAALVQPPSALPACAVYALRVLPFARTPPWTSLSALRRLAPPVTFMTRARAAHAVSLLWDAPDERADAPSTSSLLLVQRPAHAPSSTGGGAGWRVYVRRGEALAAWLHLVHAGARVIGECEAEHLAAEFHTRHFPCDWPHSPAGAAWAAAAHANALAAWHARPRAHRPAHAPTLTVAHSPRAALRCVWLLLDGGGRAACGDPVLHPVSRAVLGHVTRAHFSWRHGCYLAVAQLDRALVDDVVARSAVCSAACEAPYVLVQRGERAREATLCLV